MSDYTDYTHVNLSESRDYGPIIRRANHVVTIRTLDPNHVTLKKMSILTGQGTCHSRVIMVTYLVLRARTTKPVHCNLLLFLFVSFGFVSPESGCVIGLQD